MDVLDYGMAAFETTTVPKLAIGMQRRVLSGLEWLAAGEPQEVFASFGGESRSIAKTVAITAGAKAAAKKATANGLHSQCEG